MYCSIILLLHMHRFGIFDLWQPHGSLFMDLPERGSQHIRGGGISFALAHSQALEVQVSDHIWQDFFPIWLILLTFKNISLFHRWFYRLAKVGIMQRGEVLQRKLLTCWRGREPEKWKKDIKRNKKNKIQTRFQNVFYTLTKKNISIYEKMGKISIGGSIYS